MANPWLAWLGHKKAVLMSSERLKRIAAAGKHLLTQANQWPVWRPGIVPWSPVRVGAVVSVVLVIAVIVVTRNRNRPPTDPADVRHAAALTATEAAREDLELPPVGPIKAAAVDRVAVEHKTARAMQPH